MLDLSIKRQSIEVAGSTFKVAIVGGTSADGLFQERDLQPVVLMSTKELEDEKIVSALVEFVGRSVIETVRVKQRK